MTTKTEKLSEKQRSYREEVAKRVMGMIERGGLNWVKDWAECGSMTPRNGKTGRPYNGGNRLYLMGLYSDPRWYTFNQAKSIGYFPRKGEKSQIIEKWGSFTAFKNGDGWCSPDAEGAEAVRMLRLQAIYHVFNAEQLANDDGEPMEPEEGNEYEISPSELWGIADNLKYSSRCKVRETENTSAFYSPVFDYINMPKRKYFKTAEGFITTLAHEMTHSTMEPMGRKISGTFGSSGYAYEELVAEMGSLYTCLALGVESSDLENDENVKNSAAYVDSWLNSLKRDPSMLFKAATAASKASDYIIERYDEKTNGKAA